MRIFDTHCHIYDPAYQDDLLEVLKRAKDNNISLLMLPGDNLQDSILASEYSKEYNFIYAEVGFHPSEIKNLDIKENLEKIKQLVLNNNKIKAIGEIGLDYHYLDSEDDKELQKVWFKKQIELANELHLPIVVHSRDAFKDTYDIINEIKPLYGCAFHCFSYSIDCLKLILKINCYIGLDGPVTYKNAVTPKEVAKYVPLDRLLIETDCPYLTPVPHRGQRNEPSFIVNTLKEIAAIRAISLEELAETTFTNGCKFFNIPSNKPVLVVEGPSDVNRLNSIIDADFVICNGAAISKETISYIKELVKTREVIVLTDPDFPGIQIRNKIAQSVPNVKHAFIDRKKASNGKKLGVAECQKDELIRALANYVSFDSQTIGSLTLGDLMKLNLIGTADSSIKREKIANHFNIGHVNAKTFLKRLNMLNISFSELEEIKNDL